MRRSAGFTLIELMVVVAIIGVLAAIAIPQYNQYVVKSKLTDAFSTLQDQQVRLEQYFQDNRNYGTGGAGGNCRGLNNADLALATPAAIQPSRYFSYTCATNDANAQSFTITATSKAGGGMGNAGDYTFTITQADVRSTTKFAGTAATLTCWINTRGATCP